MTQGVLSVDAGRTAVVMSAVHVKPGRTSGTCSSSVTTTLKFVACRCPVACCVVDA